MTKDDLISVNSVIINMIYLPGGMRRLRWWSQLLPKWIQATHFPSLLLHVGHTLCHTPPSKEWHRAKEVLKIPRIVAYKTWSIPEPLGVGSNCFRREFFYFVVLDQLLIHCLYQAHIFQKDLLFLFDVRPFLVLVSSYSFCLWFSYLLYFYPTIFSVVQPNL